MNSFFVVKNLLTWCCLIAKVHGGAVQLDSSNFDHIIGNTELVFINFYADWCRFSNILAPTWDETADNVRAKHPENKVVIGKVDCDQQSSISSRFHITKYPTLKLLRNGQVTKREYRGQRSVEAFSGYIDEQLREPIKVFTDFTELTEVEAKKRVIIGYFETESDSSYSIFKHLSMNFKDDCLFFAGFGETVKHLHPPGQDIIVFRSSITQEDEVFPSSIENFDELSAWASERCVPLVREITFENAEEMTEEGLPFLILFHLPEDVESLKKYIHIVKTELADQKQNVNFLTADGLQFAHPLHHLGKSKSDLPLIAIDSFRHMYLFPEMDKPGKLKQFLSNLYSGKLHREFHYGPDLEIQTEAVLLPQIEDNQDTKSDGSSTQQQKRPTTPPESTFKKLAPSKNRYTLLKDEL